MKYIQEVLTVTDEAYKAQRTTLQKLNQEFDLDKQGVGNKLNDTRSSPKGDKILKAITDIPKLEKLSEEIKLAKIE